ncbi:protealysin inhibitor emfourin [Spirillospora sp. NPDC048911]|uniref:protealysin inhibitor emfourin n=1 Tax=Spirillospora sp. NPDC048911 TaxID=3364527 RepID=UPI00372326A0
MRVKIESTGGFAGDQVMVAMYDTDDLPGHDADRIREAVDALAAAKESGEPGEIGADLPAYRVTIGDVDGDQRVFEVEGAHPDALDEPLTVLLRGPSEPEEPPEGTPPGKPPSPSGL